MSVQVTGDSVPLKDQGPLNKAVMFHKADKIWRRSRPAAICNAFKLHFQLHSGYIGISTTHFRQVLNQGEIDLTGKMILSQFGVLAIQIKPCSLLLNNQPWDSKLQNQLEIPKWTSHRWSKLSSERQQMSFHIPMRGAISTNSKIKWSNRSWTTVSRLSRKFFIKLSECS